MVTINKKIIGLLFLFIATTASAQLGWEKIAEVKTDLSLDRIKIDCSHRGTFKSIKFKAEGSIVDFERVVVRYAVGTTDNLQFNQHLKPGQFSRNLDLRGNRRAIKEIIIHVKADPKFKNLKGKGKRTARVEVWGRK